MKKTISIGCIVIFMTAWCKVAYTQEGKLEELEEIERALEEDKRDREKMKKLPGRVRNLEDKMKIFEDELADKKRYLAEQKARINEVKEDLINYVPPPPIIEEISENLLSSIKTLKEYILRLSRLESRDQVERDEALRVRGDMAVIVDDIKKVYTLMDTNDFEAMKPLLRKIRLGIVEVAEDLLFIGHCLKCESGQYQIHTIQRGETLWDLGKIYFPSGHGLVWDIIFFTNASKYNWRKERNVDGIEWRVLISPGQQAKIPTCQRIKGCIPHPEIH